MSGLQCGLDGCPGQVMADGFCDTCGRQPAKAARFSAITSVAASETFDDPPCPGCGAARDLEALFCEACGFDFVKGKAPSAPVARPSSTGDVTKTPKPSTAPSPSTPAGSAATGAPRASGGTNDSDGSAAPTGEQPEPAPTAADGTPSTAGPDAVDPAPEPIDPAPEPTEPAELTWEAVVETDATWYARFCETWKASHGDDCPIPFPGDFSRTQMIGGPVVVIGRHAAGIDLAKPPNDAAVSHRHASLIRQQDGTYALTDLDSSNGTYVDEGPIAKGQTTAIGDGESFTVGAFTRITLNFIGAPT